MKEIIFVSRREINNRKLFLDAHPMVKALNLAFPEMESSVSEYGFILYSKQPIYISFDEKLKKWFEIVRNTGRGEPIAFEFELRNDSIASAVDINEKICEYVGIQGPTIEALQRLNGIRCSELPNFIAKLSMNPQHFVAPDERTQRKLF